MTYTLLRCLPVTFLLTRSYAFILTSMLYQVAHKEQLAAVAMAAREVALKNGRSDHERIAALEQQSQLLQAQLRTAEQHCDDLRDQLTVRCASCCTAGGVYRSSKHSVVGSSTIMALAIVTTAARHSTK
eukprot:3774-Heterococcus_DN1.PRE.4